MKLSIVSDLFTHCWWWLLFWMFLSFLLGWLLRKYLRRDKYSTCSEKLELWKRKYSNLEGKYNALKSGERIETVAPITTLGGKKPKGTSKSKGNLYAKLRENNLQIVEGIGPKMDEVLKKYGVGNWAALAGNTASELRGILDKENPQRYKIIDPTTWSDQAQLAVDGKWQELITMQKALDTGKTDAIGETDSKLEKMMVRLGLIKKWKQNDLKAIEGVGPKIEKLFHENGLKTWKDMSKTSVKKLNDILSKGGDRFKLADPGTWPKQAKLADEGKWDELREYQDFLDGGR